MNARNALYRGHEAFNVLHVHRRHHIDLRVQQVHYVFVPLVVPASLNVRVREVIDEDHLRSARQDRIHIHLFK